MNETIGEAAGMIWKFLDQQSQSISLSTIRKSLPLSSTLIMMALGWLAREEKIDIEMPEDYYSYNISIKR